MTQHTRIYIDLWEKDVARHSGGIMHVWDAGAVPKNKYRPLVWRWLEECRPPQLSPGQLVFTGLTREKAKDPAQAPATFNLIILTFVNVGNVLRPRRRRVKLSLLLVISFQTEQPLCLAK